MTFDEWIKKFPYRECRQRKAEDSDNGTCSNESCENYRVCRWYFSVSVAIT